VIAISLQSGSNGNCIYVETDGIRLLFDAGICGTGAASRLKRYGRDIREVDALIISHDHVDHIRYAGVYQRKYGLPIHITPKTLYKAETENNLGKLRQNTIQSLVTKTPVERHLPHLFSRKGSRGLGRDLLLESSLSFLVKITRKITVSS